MPKNPLDRALANDNFRQISRIESTIVRSRVDDRASPNRFGLPALAVHMAADAKDCIVTVAQVCTERAIADGSVPPSDGPVQHAVGRRVRNDNRGLIAKMVPLLELTYDLRFGIKQRSEIHFRPE